MIQNRCPTQADETHGEEDAEHTAMHFIWI